MGMKGLRKQQNKWELHIQLPSDVLNRNKIDSFYSPIYYIDAILNEIQFFTVSGDILPQVHTVEID